MNIATIFMGGQTAVPELAEAAPDQTEVGFDVALFEAQLAILGPPGESPPDPVLTGLGAEELVEGPIAPRIEPDDSESATPMPAMDWLAALLTWKSDWMPTVPVVAASNPEPVTTASPVFSIPVVTPEGKPIEAKAVEIPLPVLTQQPNAAAPERWVEIEAPVLREANQEVPMEVVRELNPTKLTVSTPAAASIELRSPDALLSHARPEPAEVAADPDTPDPQQQPKIQKQATPAATVPKATTREAPVSHRDQVQSAVIAPHATTSEPKATQSDPRATQSDPKPTADKPVATMAEAKPSDGQSGTQDKPTLTPQDHTKGENKPVAKVTAEAKGVEPKATKDNPEPVEATPSKPERVTPQTVHLTEPQRVSPKVTLDAPTREAIVAKAADAIDRLIESRPFGQVKIQLHPDDLGSITVTVRTIGHRVEADIVATNDAVRGALESSRPLLAPVVEAKGLQLGNLTINNPTASTWSDGHSHQADPQAQQQFQQMVGQRLTRQESEATPQGPTRWPAWSGQLDLMI